MLLILNNKSHFKLEEFKDYVNKLSTITHNHQLVLCPSSCYLALTIEKDIVIGSQNVSKTNSDSVTGEITATQLKSMGISYCIVGHCERRITQYETDADINKKIKNLLSENIVPVLCVGETKEEYALGLTRKILLSKIDLALDNLSQENINQVIIAYEPIWSVEIETPPPIEVIEENISFIKEKLPHNKVLYGGGVNINNFNHITKVSSIDGLLLGKLGCDVDSLKKSLENNE